jgi:pilus assembly protein Flp/PilA
MLRIKCPLIARLRASDEGATAIEYGLIAALLVITVLVSMRSALTASINMWNKVSNQVETATN